MSGATDEQISETRKTREPALQRHIVRFRHRPDIDDDFHAGTFGQHRRGPDNAALADILGGRGKPGLGERRQNFQIAAQPRRRGRRRRVPVGERRPVLAAQIHRGDQNFARLRIKTRQQFFGAPQNRDSKLALLVAQIRVPADDRHAKNLGGGAQPGQHRRGRVPIGPHRIHHGHRSAAHRRHIGEIDHHAAPAGKPGIGGDEFVHEPFDGEEQIAVAIRYRGAIIPHRHGTGAGYAEPRGDLANVAFGGQARARPQRSGQGMKVTVARHESMIG